MGVAQFGENGETLHLATKLVNLANLGRLGKIGKFTSLAKSVKQTTRSRLIPRANTERPGFPSLPNSASDLFLLKASENHDFTASRNKVHVG